MKLISTFVSAAAVSSLLAGVAMFKEPFSEVTGAVDENGYMVFPKASDKSPFAQCYREKLGATGDILRTRDRIDVLFGDEAAAKKYAVEYASTYNPEVIIHVPAEVFKSRHDRITRKCTP